MAYLIKYDCFACKPTKSTRYPYICAGLFSSAVTGEMVCQQREICPFYKPKEQYDAEFAKTEQRNLAIGIVNEKGNLVPEAQAAHWEYILQVYGVKQDEQGGQNE